MRKNTAPLKNLLSATEEMKNYADRPIITMSMSAAGVISRLCGGVFGSAMTFGTVGAASAPGQIPVKQLKESMKILHKRPVTTAQKAGA
ncbi:type I 3-dehydroquinate dehydratase [[Clostridium] aminophilum]|uniref:type I 3-dehydroquinate dehydratase n=1 Tax=[Clostridium] aminophilum TaxID=1526 RepID=UPI003F9931E0